MANRAVDFADNSWPFATERVALAITYARTHGLTREWRDSHPSGSGLVLRVGPRSASYYARIRVAGRMTAANLGPAEGTGRLSVEDARRELQRHRFSPDKPANRRKAVGDIDHTPNLGDVADAYIVAHAAGEWLPGGRTRVPTDRTMLNYRNARRAQLAAHEGLTLAAFAEQLPAIHKMIRSTAPVQADRFAQLVRNIFAYAIDRGLWGGQNPAIGTSTTTRLPKAGDHTRTRFLDDVEWERLSATMDARPSVWVDMFRVSLHTLQRMGAVSHMRWVDITFGRDPEWRIPKQFMKGRREGHTVPLANLPEVLAILKARKKGADGSPWVFPAPANSQRPATKYSGRWETLIRKAGLWCADREKRPRPHDLRRTGGARMTMASVPVQTITRALGNSAASVSMVARTYAPVADAALRDAFAAIGTPKPVKPASKRAKPSPK